MKSFCCLLLLLAQMAIGLSCYASEADSVEVVISRRSVLVEDACKVVPIYKFKDDVVGEFLNRFCDSLVAAPDVGPQFRVLNYADELPRVSRNKLDSILFDMACIETIFMCEYHVNQCVGVIETDNGTYGLLKSINEHWLETLHLTPTGRTAKVETQCIEPALPYLFDPPYLVSYFYVYPTGKVDVPAIEYFEGRKDIRLKVKQSFGWIDDFYRAHGYSIYSKFGAFRSSNDIR